jgi:predicted transcriptional regulator
MGVVQLPDDLKKVIDRQVAAGRVPSEAAFLSEAVRQYAATLEADDEIAAAVDEGIADIEAGRFELIATPEDMARLRAELRASRLKQVPP